MPELDFAVEGVAALPHTAVPTLGFRLRVTGRGPEEVRGVALECQVRIEATRRRYGEGEKDRLRELFGEPGRWPQTVRSLLWGHAHVNVPPFSGGAVVELPMPCTYDSVFFAGEDGALRMGRLPWSKEAGCALPVATWRSLMETHFPNSAWLRVRRDVFDRLLVYRSRRGALGWDDTMERLLAAAEEVQPT